MQDLYLAYVKEETPSIDAFETVLNGKDQSKPLLPRHVLDEMGNGHDSIQGHRNPDAFDGQETYGTKGAYVKYLIKHVDYFYDDSSSKPTYRVTSEQPPLSYRGWLLSEHNRGDYAMPPNPFGDVVPMYGVSLADPHLFYTRADAEMIIKSDNALHKLWHNRLQQTFVSASDAHPRMPNLCMFEPTWQD